MTLVSRRDRQTDLGALLLIIAGVAVYLFAVARLNAISLYSKANPGPPGALVAADQARYTSYAGVVLITLGCCVGVVAAVLHRRRRLAV
ncbi:MAG: hypothetical protein JWL95_3201 [Gemmatimonadetes bacterium]|nr:hypothetical protein [Gemmatimonadota bacterium]